jgi:hypothetical protein
MTSYLIAKYKLHDRNTRNDFQMGSILYNFSHKINLKNNHHPHQNQILCHALTNKIKMQIIIQFPHFLHQNH